jgi:hypothetical protein
MQGCPCWILLWVQELKKSIEYLPKPDGKCYEHVPLVQGPSDCQAINLWQPRSGWSRPELTRTVHLAIGPPNEPEFVLSPEAAKELTWARFSNLWKVWAWYNPHKEMHDEITSKTYAGNYMLYHYQTPDICMLIQVKYTWNSDGVWCYSSMMSV